MTSFHGIQPKEILYIPRSLCTLKDTSLPHLLKIFHGIIISVEICVCLLSWFSHTKFIGSCNPQGYNYGSNDVKSQTLGQKASHLRFCQSARRHGSYIILAKVTGPAGKGSGPGPARRPPGPAASSRPQSGPRGTLAQAGARGGGRAGGDAGERCEVPGRREAESRLDPEAD